MLLRVECQLAWWVTADIVRLNRAQILLIIIIAQQLETAQPWLSDRRSGQDSDFATGE
jgi:hypothetical protein